jgi:DNA-directed RNA polymerase I, II, and III subunit RPABC2
MSDDEYYSDPESSSSDEESTNLKTGKNPSIVNAARNFDDYEEESDQDDADPDDADQDDADPDDVQEDDPDEIGDEEDDEENKYGGGEEEDLDDDAEQDADSDIEIDDEGVAIEKTTKPVKSKKTTQLPLQIVDDDNDDDEYEENYLQKFDNEINKNYITEFHPECLNHNSDEVMKLSKVVRDENNIIIDPLHKTLPYLTKYEKARILGQRAKQIESGSKPFVKVPENIIDSYVIAELELREKKIPFIIKRPIPGGAFEYWSVKDLENINF